MNTVNISKTPIAPYLKLLEGMGRDEKIAVVMYLIDSIPGIKIVESETESMSSDDEAFLAKKLEEMTFSPRIEELFEKRKEIAKTVDLNDERTRHILGL